MRATQRAKAAGEACEARVAHAQARAQAGHGPRAPHAAAGHGPACDTSAADAPHTAAGSPEDAPSQAPGNPLPRICWFFMGLGVYRAWIEVAFVGSFVSYPQQYGSRSLFDVACVVVLFALALLSRRVSPLYGRRRLAWGAGCLMALASGLGFLAIACPELAASLGLPASIVGGAGLAVVILLWSELYGCLSPVRIALYYALSQLVGAAVIWTLRGFALPWLAAWTCALPFISLAMLFSAFKALPAERRPRPIAGARFSFPVKPVVLVCLYAFAFGLQEANTYAFTGPHSGFGLMVTAASVVVGIAVLSRRIDFGTLYSVWLPALMMVSLVLSLVGAIGAFWTSFFMSVSYGAAELFIMTMVGSLCHRYGVSAVWIFGIERGVRMLAMMAGRCFEPLAHGWPVAGIVVAAVVVGTCIIFSERGTSASWGIVLYEEGDDLYRTARLNALGRRCAELGRAHGLTEREQEVLFLLAQRKSAGDIERELCVAHGTAKAHIRHVYRKLDIHAREELFALVDFPTGEE